MLPDHMPTPCSLSRERSVTYGSSSDESKRSTSFSDTTEAMVPCRYSRAKLDASLGSAARPAGWRKCGGGDGRGGVWMPCMATSPLLPLS